MPVYGLFLARILLPVCGLVSILPAGTVVLTARILTGWQRFSCGQFPVGRALSLYGMTGGLLLPEFSDAVGGAVRLTGHIGGGISGHGFRTSGYLRSVGIRLWRFLLGCCGLLPGFFSLCYMKICKKIIKFLLVLSFVCHEKHSCFLISFRFLL